MVKEEFVPNTNWIYSF